MLTRMLPFFKVLVVVLALGLAVVAVLLIQQIIAGPPETPRSELERAVAAAESSVRANPEDPAARVKLAAAYLEQGSPSLAIEHAEIAISLAPEDPAGYYVLGLAHDRAGDTDKAVENLNTAVGIEGQVAQFYQDAYVAMARVLEEAGEREEALEAMDSALQYGPENALLLYERGTLYEKDANLEFALMDYMWALQYVPGHEPSLEAYNRIVEEHPDVHERVRELLQEEEPAMAPSSSDDSQ